MSSLQLQTGFSVAFALMTGVSLIGNTLVILVIVKHDSRKTPVNYLLLNLASADTLVGVFFGLQYVVKPTVPHPDGTIGTLLCKLVTGGIPGWVGAVTSVFSLVAIAVERYCAVVFPYTRRGKFTRKKIALFATASWMLALLWNVPGFATSVYIKELRGCGVRWPKELYANLYTIGWTIIAGVVPIGTMAFLYSKVIRRLWFASQTVQTSQRSVMRHRRRVTKMVMAVTVMYVLCWVPELTIYFLGLTGSITLTEIHFSMASALVALNSCVNPVFYSLQSSAFRKHLRQVICCVKSRKESRVRPG